MNMFQTIVNRVTNHTDNPPYAARQVAQRLLDAAQADTDMSLSSSLCKWLPLCNYIGNRPANRIAS
jgi:hypothetical protein